MFFVGAARENAVPAIVSEKLFTVVDPYFLWSVFLIVANWATSSLVNKPFSLDALWTLTTQPVGPFWFLYVLLFVQAIALVLFRVFRLSSVTAVGIGLVMLAASPAVEAYVPHQILFHFVFFAAGAALAERTGLHLRIDGRLAVGLVALFLCGLWVVLPTGIPYPTLALVPLGVIGVAAIVGIAWRGGNSAFAGRLGWLMALGRASMAIYVTHMVFTAGTRILLLKFAAVTSVPLHVACGMAAGLAFPMVAWFLARRLGLQPLFGFAAPRPGGARAARA